MFPLRDISSLNIAGAHCVFARLRVFERSSIGQHSTFLQAMVLPHIPAPILPMAPSWFPGHMMKFTRMLPALLTRTDVVLEIRDSRLPLTSINRSLEGVCSFPASPSECVMTYMWHSCSPLTGFFSSLLRCAGNLSHLPKAGDLLNIIPPLCINTF